MGNAALIFRTVRHLKFVQVWNRVVRRFVPRRVRGGALEASPDFAPLAPFPRFRRTAEGDDFTFLNETHRAATPEDWNNPALKKLWLYNLHYFDCLRQEGGYPGGRALIERWIAENPVGKGNGWEPYPISLRVVNWIKWAAEGNVLTAAMRESVCLQIRWLEKRLEYHLLANHLLANAKALVFAGVFFKGDEARRWYEKGLAIYRKELPEQVLADGVHFERSAMYHAIMLEDVIDCANVAGKDAAFFGAYAEKMLAGLDLLTGPDGRIAKFNDAAEGIALEVKALREYAGRMGLRPVADSSDGVTPEQSNNRTIEQSCTPASGYFRLRQGDWTLIVKGGAIGPDYQPGHAHADTGTFELWRKDVKLVTDTGTDRYAVDAERRRQRGSAAHNVVVVDGADSSEVWGGHRVARRARVTEAAADGRTVRIAYTDRRGFRHRRLLVLSEDGLAGEDTVEGRGEHLVEVRFHVPPGAEVRVEGEGGGPAWEACDIAEEFGRTVKGRCAVLTRRAELPVTIKWRVG